MNERIKELVKQAEQYALDKANEPEEDFEFSFDDDFQEKFAELIVRECAEACEKNSYLALNGWQRAKQIREHFGVEE
jgi:hypothetical protein